LFFVLTLWAYARYAHTSRITHHVSRITHHALLSYLLTLFCFTLGLLSKPMLVTVPFVLLLLDFWPLNRWAEQGNSMDTPDRWWLLVEKIPFIALAVAASVIAYLAQQKAHALSLNLPLSSRLANAVASYVKYIGKTFWPANLIVYYPHPDIRYPESHQWPFWALVLSALGLAAVSLAAIIRRRTLPWLVTGWFWFLGMLVPVIGFVQAGTFGMADRYTYLPLIGLFICIVWGAAAVMARLFHPGELERRVLAVTAGVGLLSCAVVANHQARFWHDTETLFRHALAVNPDNAPAHFKIGSLEGARGNFEAALQHFRDAIRAEPNYVSAYYSLGMTLEALGKPTEAVEAYQDAVRISPWFDAAYNRLGMVLTGLGRTEEACRAYSDALRANPDSADAQFNWGAALLQLGQPQEAIAHFTAAARLSPADPGARAGLGRALELAGKTADAVAAYQRALTLQPDFAPALRGLAWIRATSLDPAFRDGAEALRLAERACQLTQSKDWRALAALDAAYAQAGRFAEAIAAAEQTRSAGLAAGQTNVAQAADARLALYRQGRPFVGPPALEELKPNPAAASHP
jgi:protein O-mannosyl-transferase